LDRELVRWHERAPLVPRAFRNPLPQRVAEAGFRWARPIRNSAARFVGRDARHRLRRPNCRFFAGDAASRGGIAVGLSSDPYDRLPRNERPMQQNYAGNLHGRSVGLALEPPTNSLFLPLDSCVRRSHCGSVFRRGTENASSAWVDRQHFLKSPIRKGNGSYGESRE